LANERNDIRPLIHYKLILIAICLLSTISFVSAIAPIAYFSMSVNGNAIRLNTTDIPIVSSNGYNGIGAPESLNGYALGGSYYGGGTQYPAYTHGVPGGSYDGSTVSTKTRLLEALNQAGNGVGGAVIYIDPSVNIDMGNTIHVKIPGNTTIASNRGVGGSPGGRIYTKALGSSWQGRLFETDGSNVRITGLRLEGEAYPENYDPPNDDEGSIYRIGLTIYHTNCVVDNNDIYGFAYANILVRDVPTNGRPWIHHNYIHGSQNRHEGYGIEVADGDVLVEGNVFDRNRHDMTGSGEESEKYTFRYNKILGTEYQIVGMSHIDVHGRGSDEQYSGTRYDIYSNTIEGGSSSAVHQRGISQGTYIYNNIFKTFPDGCGWTYQNVPIYQTCYPQCGNMHVTNNYWSPVKNGQIKLYPTESGIVWYQGG